MNLKIRFSEEVKERHKERVPEVIESCTLKNKPNDWEATSSDFYRDRVYLYNNTLDKEFSIAFNDSKSGYNYYVYERNVIDEKQYNALLEERPELAELGREAIASVVELCSGFKRKFIPRRENFFKDFLKKNDLDIKNEKIFLSLGISSSNMAFNTIIQAMPWSESIIVIDKIPFNEFEEVFMGLTQLNSSTLVEELNQKAFSTRIVVDGNINMIVDDIIEFYEELGYTINYGTLEN